MALNRLQEMLMKRSIKKRLSACNFELAREIIAKNFSGRVLPNKLCRLFDNFMNTPCVETGYELVKFDRRFITLFDLSKKGDLTELLYTEHKKDKEKSQ